MRQNTYLFKEYIIDDSDYLRKSTIMKILLATLNAKYIHTNLAIRLLYALYKDKASLEWYEFTIKEKKEDIVAYCKDYQIVAFSCYIWNITQTLAVCKLLKEKYENIHILLGGPEVSYEYETIITLPYVDYIICGEGEIPFGHFIDKFPQVQNIPGIVSKSDSTIQFLPQNEVFDLQKYEGINPYMYDSTQALATKIIYVETSRGCPYKCSFCLASLDNKVRYLPTKTTKEILLYAMCHAKTIKFLDRTFNIKKDFTLSIFDFILAHYNAKNVFQFEITADILHKDIIAYIQEKVPNGLLRFEIGIQTIHKASNLAVQRKQDFEKTKDIIKQIQNKIVLHLDLIVGLPYDDLEAIQDSIEQVFALYPDELQLGFLKFLKGTPLRTDYDAHAYIYDKNPPYQIIESKYLSKADLKQITEVEFALEIFWNKKRIPTVLKYLSLQNKVYSFLYKIGSYFLQQYGEIHYTLKNIYDAVMYIITRDYTEDEKLYQLALYDYFNYAKIKPVDYYSNALHKNEKYQWLEQMHLPHAIYRYELLDVNLCIETFLQEKRIVNKDIRICFQYDGKTPPHVSFHQLQCEV